ncbi:MAG: DEAD/DEAH box helicase [Bacteroidetes bacterium]|nr:DEAD/DEAH box helicase [Bacteroidota bacterium]MDA1335866.1 DEAD/DEAH box helicase [Bacteroidota bacterium]
MEEEIKRMRFEDLPLHPDVLDALDAMGFENATPIQEKAIPVILQGKDFLGIAQTGTGKTAAFLLPIIDRILDTEDNRKTKALIVVPTRELALQIDQAVEGFGYYARVTSLAIYGGGSATDFSREKKALTDGADIIIATPGRFLSHLTLGYVDLSELQCLILDEADRMLDMGFLGDIMRIAEKCKKERQTLLFSATMPDRIETLARDLQRDPQVVKLALSKPAEKIKQGAYVLFDHQKDEVLVQLLLDRNVSSGIVFTSRKRTVSQITRVLKKAGIKCERISSDSDQSEREEVMLGFRQRKFPILVATDVVSRGIDIDNIELVVNYDVPPNEEDYVHRIGRTARADREGEGVTLVNPDDQRRFGRIEKLIEREVPKLSLPSKIGTGPDYNPGKGGARNDSADRFKRGNKRASNSNRSNQGRNDSSREKKHGNKSFNRKNGKPGRSQ